MMGFNEQYGASQMVEVEIWRATKKEVYNQWGDYDPDLPDPPIAALYGREMVDKAFAVVEPRTTRFEPKSGQTDGVSTTGMTLFFSDLFVDIRPDDMFAFIGHNGRYGAWKLDGEGSENNYVSPFTGMTGGREVFITRVREIK